MTKPNAAANAAGLPSHLDDAQRELWQLAWLVDTLAREIIDLPRVHVDGRRSKCIDRVDALACVARDQVWRLHGLIESLNAAEMAL